MDQSDVMKLAFEIGEKKFGIPSLLDPQDVISKPDERSIMVNIISVL
jgi:hypothetical protein